MHLHIGPLFSGPSQPAQAPSPFLSVSPSLSVSDCVCVCVCPLLIACCWKTWCSAFAQPWIEEVWVELILGPVPGQVQRHPQP
jgi:hypothetical protein